MRGENELLSVLFAVRGPARKSNSPYIATCVVGFGLPCTSAATRLWRAVIRYSCICDSGEFGIGMPLKVEPISDSSLRDRNTLSKARKPPSWIVTSLYCHIVGSGTPAGALAA